MGAGRQNEIAGFGCAGVLIMIGMAAVMLLMICVEIARHM